MTQPEFVLGGRYHLDQVIGRGGMAEVWRARDTRLGRDVAVKRLRVDLATDPTFQARFRREAQSAAGLNHPNIVATYDTGEEPDEKTGIAVPYIVMELVEGHTLRDLLRGDRRIRPEKALEWSQGVLDALQHSHKAGIIHRDIKPANVMLTPNGHVTVMDFGIARAVADTSATMTQTAAVIGTAQYLSPEQARGETVDSRSDIYSAGCLLYELLTGRPPFVGDSPVSVAYQHVRETPVAPSELDPELTPAMDAIVLKSLAKDPAQRYQSAKEMRDDIARLLAGHEVTALLPTPVAAAAPTAVTQLMGEGGATAADAQADTVVPVQDSSPAGEELEEEEEPRRSGLAKLIWALLALLLLVGGFFAYQVLSRPDTSHLAQVPAVISQNEKEATSEVEQAGFVAKVEHVNGPSETEGQVTDQDPAAGRQAEKGSTVTLKLNDGPATNKIPAGLVGMSEAQARKALTDAGFPAKNITVKDATATEEAEHLDFKAGQVVKSNPASGAEVVPATQKVTLARATGRSQVPNLMDQTQDAATKQAAAAGFQVSVNTVETSQQSKNGKVVEQSPRYPTQLARTEPIAITVGKYTQPTTVRVPNLVGKDQASAQQELAQLGLKATVTTAQVSDPNQVGVVQDQNPGSGTSVERNTTVTIAIGELAPSEQPTTTEPTQPDDSGSTEPGDDETSEAPSPEPPATSEAPAPSPTATATSTSSS